MKRFKQIKHGNYLIILLLLSITLLSGCGYEKETRSVLVSSSYSKNSTSDTTNIKIPEINKAPSQVRETNTQSDFISSIIQNPIVPNTTITPTPSTAAIENKTLTLLAVGDNLIHEQVIKSGKQSDGSYNFDHLFTHLKDEISGADIAIINQETILGGSDFPYTGYPVFNSPIEIGDAIINAGFDVVLHATNHAMDKGFEGVNNTIHYWEKHKNITMVGLNSSNVKQETIPVIERNGIKVALLNYTYGLNGYTLPKDKPYLVNMLDKTKIKEDIRKAKQVSDFIIVFPHWGTEYVYEPDKNQKDWTSFFAQEGVDLVIGTHPHVVEPIEWIQGDNGHKMLVYYSLGNYVSYQREAPRMLGGMAKITLEKKDSKVSIKENEIIPIVTHYENHDNYEYGVYKLSEYTNEQALKHGVIELAENSLFTLESTIRLANDVFGNWIK